MALSANQIEELLNTANGIKERCKEILLKEGFAELRLRERELEHEERELEYNAQMKAQEMEHVERMRSLEVGQPLPEAYTTRIRAVASIGTVVPIALATAAAAASIMLFEQPLTKEGGGSAEAALSRAVPLGLIWATCGLVILLTVGLCLRTLQQFGVWSNKQTSKQPGQDP